MQNVIFNKRPKVGIKTFIILRKYFYTNETKAKRKNRLLFSHYFYFFFRLCFPFDFTFPGAVGLLSYNNDKRKKKYQEKSN